MRLLNPATRQILPTAIFSLLLIQVFWAWIFIQFVHRDAQARLLDPKHYDVQVLTAAEHARLIDPAQRVVTLSDGTTIEKAPIWDGVVAPKYKPTNDSRYYVLVTTLGTAHLVSYLTPYLVLFGFIAGCGIVASWRTLPRPNTAQPTVEPQVSPKEVSH